MFNKYETPFKNSPKLKELYTDNLFKAVDMGLELMKKSTDEQLVQAWQEYVKTVLRVFSEQSGKHFYTEYLLFLLTIVKKSPYDQVKESIQKLLEIIKAI